MRPRVVAIVQARMGSTRLPGKVLLNLAGQPLLAHVLHRLQRARLLDGVVVATCHGAENGRIVDLAETCGVDLFVGDEADVLGRYLAAAQAFSASVIIRVCADSPLVDPDGIDWALTRHRLGSAAVTHNKFSLGAVRGYADGGGAEVISLDTLQRLNELARDPADREHVTRYAFAHPDLFRIETVGVPEAVFAPSVSLVVDTQEDLERFRWVYDCLFRPGQIVDLGAAIALLSGAAHGRVSGISPACGIRARTI